MLRLTFTLFAGLSAVLRLATVVEWPRSYYTRTFVFIDDPGDSIVITQFNRGEFRTVREMPQHTIPLSRFEIHEVEPDELIDPRHDSSGTVYVDFAGAYFERQVEQPGSAIDIIVVPLWLIALLFAILPAWWFATLPRHRRAVRRRKGLCERCAYDLTGCTSDACPECGARVHVKDVQKA